MSDAPFSLPDLKLDAAGLVTVVVQDPRSGTVRMLAHADEAALRATAATGYAHFFSRSRERMWKKGEESGNTLKVLEMWIDCDRDAVVYVALPAGPTCHTGAETCFTERLLPAGAAEAGEGVLAPRALPILAELERVLAIRKRDGRATSYTVSLLRGGADAIGGKLREEADELAVALAEESDERVASEAADVLYHLLVGLRSRDLGLDAVTEALAARFGRSGFEEKAARGT
jgi:phosphoribosyl-ATP pyrophosphohydrolase/phosphoribosyl-AMP cyclohydrolase